MNKNTIIVINPTNTNIMKAICNAIVSNIINIIILGNKEIIQNLCDKLNISINLFRIIDCKTEKEMFFKLKQCQEKINISGIIIDDIKDIKIKEELKDNYLCHVIDFGVFKKSIFIINDNQKDNINDKLSQVFTLINKLNINDINIGIVSYNKEKAILKRKQLKESLQISTIDIIDFEKIKKGYYNIIIFETKQLKQTYLSQINELVLPRVVEIKKASNTIVYDAKGKKFKNIFFQIVLFSKLNGIYKELNAQIV